MNSIKAFTDALSSCGNSIGTVFYRNSNRPLKNVCFGARSVRNPPYGEPINNVLFKHNGNLYLRVVDNNDGHTPKNLKVSEVSSIRVRNMSWGAA